MYEIRVKATFSSAHNLRNYRGRCEHLHGHNWVIEAVFSFAKLGSSGLAIDFKAAKAMLRDVTERLDHAYLNDLPFFKRTNPTSENIARFIYTELRRADRHVSSVSVWENESSCATYSEERKRR